MLSVKRSVRYSWSVQAAAVCTELPADYTVQAVVQCTVQAAVHTERAAVHTERAEPAYMVQERPAVRHTASSAAVYKEKAARVGR